jgi:hypothetical protein
VPFTTQPVATYAFQPDFIPLFLRTILISDWLCLGTENTILLLAFFQRKDNKNLFLFPISRYNISLFSFLKPPGCKTELNLVVLFFHFNNNALKKTSAVTNTHKIKKAIEVVIQHFISLKVSC